MENFDFRLRNLEVSELFAPIPDSARDSLDNLNFLVLSGVNMQVPDVQSFFTKPYRCTQHLDIRLMKDVLPSFLLALHRLFLTSDFLRSGSPSRTARRDSTSRISLISCS